MVSGKAGFRCMQRIYDERSHSSIRTPASFPDGKEAGGTPRITLIEFEKLAPGDRPPGSLSQPEESRELRPRVALGLSSARDVKSDEV
jgi:hypothetical protein